MSGSMCDVLSVSHIFASRYLETERRGEIAKERRDDIIIEMGLAINQQGKRRIIRERNNKAIHHNQRKGYRICKGYFPNPNQ